MVLPSSRPRGPPRRLVLLGLIPEAALTAAAAVAVAVEVPHQQEVVEALALAPVEMGMDVPPHSQMVVVAEVGVPAVTGTALVMALGVARVANRNNHAATSMAAVVAAVGAHTGTLMVTGTVTTTTHHANPNTEGMGTVREVR
jgi:hypothetical protein